MLYRSFRQISTGRWLKVLITFEKTDSQNTPSELHRAEIASGFGIAPSDIEVVDDTIDRRAGVLVPAPPPVAPALSAIELAQAKGVTDASADLVASIDGAFAARASALTNSEKDAIQGKVVALIARAQGR